jgi:hypothetical protein
MRILDDIGEFIWLCDIDNTNYEGLELGKPYTVYFHDDTENTHEFRCLERAAYIGCFSYFDYDGPCLEFTEIKPGPPTGEIWRLATGEYTFFIREAW